MRTDLLLLMAAPVAGLGAFIALQVCRYAVWAWRGGTRIEIPWEAQAPPYSRFAHRRRTRKEVTLTPGANRACALLFWKLSLHPSLDDRLFDAITGFAGISIVALDFSSVREGARWVITSGEFHLRGKQLSGPHYAPFESCKGASLARVDISGVIDAEGLLGDLQAKISDPAVRHKGHAIFSYLLGTTRDDRVTCSGLIGQSILRQGSQPLARALRQALKDRYTYGEISPADLARAVAILNLSTEEVPERRIRAIPVLKRRGSLVHAVQSRPKST